MIVFGLSGYSELTKTITALPRLAVLSVLSAARRLVLIFVNSLQCIGKAVVLHLFIANQLHFRCSISLPCRIFVSVFSLPFALSCSYFDSLCYCVGSVCYSLVMLLVASSQCYLVIPNEAITRNCSS